MGVAGTYGTASRYRFASAHVQLGPEDVFRPAVQVLLESESIKITELDEAQRRCAAVAGTRTISVRVVESLPGRSRLSVLVGDGGDPGASEALAVSLLRKMCGRLGAACE